MQLPHVEKVFSWGKDAPTPPTVSSGQVVMKKRIEGRMDGRGGERLTYELTLGLNACCASEDSAVNAMLRLGQNSCNKL